MLVPLAVLVRYSFLRHYHRRHVCAALLTGRPQPLSLLLSLSPLVDELALYDVVNTPGVAADLSHISSKAVSDRHNREPRARELRLTFAANRKPPATFPPMTAPRPPSRMPTSLSSPLAFPVRPTGAVLLSRRISADDDPPL